MVFWYVHLFKDAFLGRESCIHAVIGDRRSVATRTKLPIIAEEKNVLFKNTYIPIYKKYTRYMQHNLHKKVISKAGFGTKNIVTLALNYYNE